MIYRVDDGYVISSRGMWLNGNYDSERAAKYAFRFPDATLSRLEKEINQAQQRSITFEDLQAARKAERTREVEHE